MLIGLAGRLGSGKDTVYERLRDAGFVPAPFSVERRSFADKLKDSACALLGMSRNTMEFLKRDESARLSWIISAKNLTQASEFMPTDDAQPFTMRTFLQRYGTESHRDIFGDDFWVQQAMTDLLDPMALYVFTDVRFENEAHAIRERGGVIWEIKGPVTDTGNHPSETPLPAELVHHVIDNTVRADDFVHLDAEIKRVLTETFSV